MAIHGGLREEIPELRCDRHRCIEPGMMKVHDRFQLLQVHLVLLQC
jgi:hypothetical protein